MMKYVTTMPITLKTSTGLRELSPGDAFIPTRPETIVHLIDQGILKTVESVICEKIETFTEWLTEHRATDVLHRLQTGFPGLHDAILDSHGLIDKHRESGNLGGLTETTERIKGLYSHAFDLIADKKTRTAYRIYSRVLECHLWVVADEKELETMREEGISEPIYTQGDIEKMKEKGLTREGLKAIHEVKKVFDRSRVEDIKSGEQFNLPLAGDHSSKEMKNEKN